MRTEEHSLARVTCAQQDFTDAHASQRVERRSWFVEDQQFGIIDKRLRQSYALEHAARKLAGVAIGNVSNFKFLQHLHGTLAKLRIVHSVQSSVEADQLGGRAMIKRYIFRKETDAAAHFAVFDNNETLCLGSVFSQKLFGFFISIGARQPAYAGSMGKVLLAGLSDTKLDEYLASVRRVAHTKETVTSAAILRREIAEVREQGYALNRGEMTPGIVGVAVPVRNKDGTVASVVNANWISTSSIKAAEIKRCLGPLREAAKQIEMRLASGAVPTGWVSRER